MRRVIGIDIHRTFGEVVTWEDGKLRNLGRVAQARCFFDRALSNDPDNVEALVGSARAHAISAYLCL